MKRRGELGLVKLNLSWEEAQTWMQSQAFKELNVQGVVDEVQCADRGLQMACTRD